MRTFDAQGIEIHAAAGVRELMDRLGEADARGEIACTRVALLLQVVPEVASEARGAQLAFFISPAILSPFSMNRLYAGRSCRRFT
jgi:hypothetical protein